MTRRMQEERERQGMSRAALARKAEMHPASIGQIESGYIGKPYPVQLAKIAAALDWEGGPEELLQEVTDHARH